MKPLTANTLPKTTPAQQISNNESEEFQTGQVVTIAGGHFFHDIYTAFIPALLPVIVDKLSLTLTMAGSLTAIQQLPGVINPFIGYLADRVSLRYFVIFAPAVTATLISSLGFAPDYITLVIILLLTGVSVAAFHAPAPAMIGRIAGRQVGKGMSYFMAAGELARTLGPLLAVWAVSLWTLDGLFRMVVLGWGTSVVLFLRLRTVPARTHPNIGLLQVLPQMRRLFLPLIAFTLFRNFMNESLVTYLPIYMDMQGASLWVAGASLSILEVAGVAGALSSGTLSDRLGRKPILLFATIASAVLMILFVSLKGWLLVPVLLALGFTALSTTPVLLALVQESLPNHRALGNGIFMFISFALRPIAILVVGFLGDNFGLSNAYLWSAGISLLAIPAIFALPKVSLDIPDGS